LYWQLEDIWVAPTWSGIEYDGRWKILHYAAKDVYEPVIIAPYYNITIGNLSVWVTSDLWDPIQGTASFEWYDWSGTRLNVNTTSSKDFSLGAINSTQVLQTFTKEVLKNYDPRDAVLKMSVTAKGNTPNSNITQTFKHESWFHPTALKDAALVDPGLELEYSDTTYNFTVRATTGVAAWVWLEHGPGVLGNFGSNAFWLGRNESREVSFKVKKDTTGGKWVNEITVQSLWNQTLQD
jgi:beta-mannosidase